MVEERHEACNIDRQVIKEHTQVLLRKEDIRDSQWSY